MKTVLFSRKTNQNPELSALKDELQQAQGELSLAYRQFDQAVDPEQTAKRTRKAPEVIAAVSLEDAAWT